MKKQVNDFVVSLGGTTFYSGKKRTMYINGPESIEENIIAKFGYSLPFKLQTN